MKKKLPWITKWQCESIGYWTESVKFANPCVFLVWQNKLPYCIWFVEYFHQDDSNMKWEAALPTTTINKSAIATFIIHDSSTIAKKVPNYNIFFTYKILNHRNKNIVWTYVHRIRIFFYVSLHNSFLYPGNIACAILYVTKVNLRLWSILPIRCVLTVDIL